MRKELENLCNDFSNAHQLISIMSRGSVEQSTFMDIDVLKGYHNEMAYALDFLAAALKEKSDALWSLIEDMEEDDNEKSGVSEEELIILTLYRELDENGRIQTKGFMEGFKYRSTAQRSVVKGQGEADTP